jgi:hypothetical protein
MAEPTKPTKRRKGNRALDPKRIGPSPKLDFRLPQALLTALRRAADDNELPVRVEARRILRREMETRGYLDPRDAPRRPRSIRQELPEWDRGLLSAEVAEYNTHEQD